MNNWLLLPPIAFCLLLAVTAVLGVLFRRLAPRGADSVGKTKAYACGEDVVTNRVQPSYSQFFPFAFFFTIMHVVALMLATVPAGGLKKFVGIAVLYLLAALSGLSILFREKIESDLAALFRR
jgi:NADH-quinone oxidoreductase subunit A